MRPSGRSSSRWPANTPNNTHREETNEFAHVARCPIGFGKKDDSVVWTKRGILQRCLPGGVAFNLVHEQVLRKVRAAGEKKGIWTEIRYNLAQPLWKVSPEAEARIEANTQPDIRHWSTTVPADVTFVDDACLFFQVDNLVSNVANCG